MRASGRMLERSRCGCLSKEQEDLQRNRGKPKPWDRTVLKTQMKKTLRQSLEFSDCEMWRTQGDPDQANQKAHLGISLKYMTREISPISRKHTAIHQNKTERLKKKKNMPALTLHPFNSKPWDMGRMEMIILIIIITQVTAEWVYRLDICGHLSVHLGC